MFSPLGCRRSITTKIGLTELSTDFFGDASPQGRRQLLLSRSRARLELDDNDVDRRCGSGWVPAMFFRSRVPLDGACVLGCGGAQLHADIRGVLMNNGLVTRGRADADDPGVLVFGDDRVILRI